MVGGLIKNVSIKELSLLCGQGSWSYHDNPMAHIGIICQILEVYERKNTLNSLCIQEAALETWPLGQVIFTTLRRCTHLKQVHLVKCDITDETLAVRHLQLFSKIRIAIYTLSISPIIKLVLLVQLILLAA